MENNWLNNKSQAVLQQLDFLKTRISTSTVEITTSLYRKTSLTGDTILFFFIYCKLKCINSWEVLRMTNVWYPKSYMEQSFKSSGMWFQNLHFNQHLKNTTCLVYNQRKSTIIYKEITPPFQLHSSVRLASPSTWRWHHIGRTSDAKVTTPLSITPDVCKNYKTHCQ